MSTLERCRTCGNPVDPNQRTAHDGACPWCLAAFAFGPESPPAGGAAESSARFGKYVRTEKLGSGGMGEVWKALDTELNRWVALKFLKEEDPSVVARFQREARTAAALSHPNIASIYDVGEIDGRHFIAMQYVPGRTMASFPRNDRTLIVRLFRDAARALEHAHRHGIIHRDLKPENLMVEEKEEDRCVTVLDFGLARAIEGGEKLSKSGEVFGTAPYMSPEQARGDRLDERADVYSLGAALYDVLTGKPPFEAPNLLELIRKVGNDEPERPRKDNPQIHRDLETIVLKCLEKDRNRRYAGAQELADDLERFLNHDAILARPPSTLYRLRMKLAKRRAVVVTAGIAAVLLAAILSWWLLIGMPAGEQLRLTAAGLKLWNEARVAAIAGGDPGDIRAKARAAREQFEGAIRTREDADANVMRARCLELEGRDDEALKSLERAYFLDPRNLDARLELAKALFLKYQSSRGTPMIGHLMMGPTAGAKVYFGDLRGETGKEREWRERGEKILGEGESAPAQESLLKGLLAMGKGDYSRAAISLETYTNAERWDVQALTLQGVCLYYARNLDGAIAALDRSLSRVPGAEGYYWRGFAKEDKGLHHEADADLTKAVELDPFHARAYVSRGRVKLGLGLLDEAIADCTTAIELDSRNSRAYNGRGCVKAAKGLRDEAIADFAKAIEIDPLYVSAWSNRGNLKREKGLHDEAIADLTRAIELNPKYAQTYVSRGNVKETRGLLDEAIADYSKAIELEPMNAWAYANRGNAKGAKGQHDEAIADCTKSIELDPKSALTYINRGNSKRAKGLHDEAIADYTKASELDPTDGRALLSRGVVQVSKGRLDEAIADFTKAIEGTPTYAEAYVERGTAKIAKGLQGEALGDFRKALEVAPSAWPLRKTIEERCRKLMEPHAPP